LFQFDGVGHSLTVLLHRVSDAGEKPSFIERLFDEVECSYLDCGHRHIDITVTRDQDNRAVKSSFREVTHKVKSRDAWRLHDLDGNPAPRFIAFFAK
jgi:hypothetical protein